MRAKPRVLNIMPQTKRHTKAATLTRGSNRKQSRRSGSATGRKPDKRPLVGADLERCLYCNKSDITKAGKRYTHHEILQRWYCRTCTVTFSPRTAGKGSTYPLQVTLEALCYFYRGFTIEETTRYINRRFGVSVHPRTTSRWLSEYRDLTTYERLREEGRRRFTPHQLIRSIRLHHKQVYTYRIHQGKLGHITESREHRRFQPVADYLTDMAENCPHHLFQATVDTGNRAS